MELNPLKNKKDFDRVFKKGKGLNKDFLLLKFLPNDLAKNRVGIIVSQKVSKKAPVRNKIKRRLKTALSANLAQTKPGFDIILMALPGLEKRRFQEIKETINELFNRRF